MNDYINDAFTREGENTNLEINNLNVGCITSKNNKFELDSNGNLVVNSIKANTLITDTTLNIMYPVGAIYLSVNDTNPTNLFGGVWEQLKDRFLLGCGDTYQNGITGGEEKHTLTVAEMPAHYHPSYYKWEGQSGGYIDGFTQVVSTAASDNHNKSNGTDGSTFGGNEPHNNMPPYLAVYMWKRVS